MISMVATQSPHGPISKLGDDAKIVNCDALIKEDMGNVLDFTAYTNS